MRDLTANQLSAVDDQVVRPVMMARLDFPVQPALIHSGVGTINYNSEDYLGVGDYGGISPITEGAEPRPYDVELSLSGIPTDLFAEVMGEQYQGKGGLLYVALLDAGHQVIDTPKQIWSGYMDYPDISLGETASIVVHCRNRANDWARPRIERYTKEQQRADYPTDSGLDFIEQPEGKEIYWGRTENTNPQGFFTFVR